MKLGNIFKKVVKQEEDPEQESNVVAKERLQLVLMQDRANVSAEFLEMMKNEIVSVVQKYIDVDEEAMDIRLTTEPNEDGTNGIPRIYANIPIIQIKNESKFGRLQIQNADGEVISEIGGKKEQSIFAEVNEGDIFAEGDEDNIEIEGTIIDRKEEVEDVVDEDVKQDNKTQVEDTITQDINSIEESIDELEEYVEEDDDDENIVFEEDEDIEDDEVVYEEDDSDDDVTFDDLLKAAEEAESNHDEELQQMKTMVSAASTVEPTVEDSELEEDSLLQKLSDIDEDESDNGSLKNSSNNNNINNYNNNNKHSHSKKHKKRR